MPAAINGMNGMIASGSENVTVKRSKIMALRGVWGLLAEWDKVVQHFSPFGAGRAALDIGFLSHQGCRSVDSPCDWLGYFRHQVSSTTDGAGILDHRKIGPETAYRASRRTLLAKLKIVLILTWCLARHAQLPAVILDVAGYSHYEVMR